MSKFKNIYGHSGKMPLGSNKNYTATIPIIVFSVWLAVVPILGIFFAIIIIKSVGNIFAIGLIMSFPVLFYGVFLFGFVHAIKEIRILTYAKKILEARRWISTATPELVGDIIAGSIIDEGLIVSKENYKISRSVRLIDETIISSSFQPILGPNKEEISYAMYDVILNITRKDKVSTAYYTVLKVKLRQLVPHLIFDSKLAEGRQMKNTYLQSQKLDLNILLSEFFTVYSPRHHEIKTLSFITPEVIEAIIALKNYDIEFVDDSLVFYSSLLPGEALADFRSKCLMMHSKVNDNLSLYTSEPDLSPLGQRLLKSPKRYIMALIPFSILIIVVDISILKSFGLNQSSFSQMMLYGAIFHFALIMGITKTVKIIRHNKRLQKEYLQNKR